MTISFVGDSAVTTDNATPFSIAPSWPAAYTPIAGDFAVIIIAQDGIAGAPTTPAGWSAFADSDPNAAGSAPLIYVFSKVLVGSDVLPTVAGTNSMSLWTLVWSGVDPSTPQDVAAVPDSSVGTSPWTPDPITTSSNGCDIANVVTTGFNYTVTDGSHNLQGFTLLESVSPTGSRTVGIARYAQTSAGSKTNPSWSSDFDHMGALTFALRPAAEGPIAYDETGRAVTVTATVEAADTYTPLISPPTFVLQPLVAVPRQPMGG